MVQEIPEASQEEAEQAVWYVNSMLPEPLPEHEINTILRRR